MPRRATSCRSPSRFVQGVPPGRTPGSAARERTVGGTSGRPVAHAAPWLASFQRALHQLGDAAAQSPLNRGARAIGRPLRGGLIVRQRLESASGDRAIRRQTAHVCNDLCPTDSSVAALTCPEAGVEVCNRDRVRAAVGHRRHVQRSGSIHLAVTHRGTPCGVRELTRRRSHESTGHAQTNLWTHEFGWMIATEQVSTQFSVTMGTVCPPLLS